jgi:CO dehydrogenase maturation factor
MLAGGERARALAFLDGLLREGEAPPALVGMKDLIEERLGSLEGFFRLNPRVDDIPDRFSCEDRGVRLLVMGGISEGGGGCACPQSAFLRNLLQHVMLERSEWVFMDCEAGLEHLGRATSRGADALLVVVEPSRSSVETAKRIRELAADIGMSRLFIVGNKVRDADERELIQRSMTELEVLACFPESVALREAARCGLPVQDPDLLPVISNILDVIEARAGD